MRKREPLTLSEPEQRAVIELVGLIQQHFPTASCEVRRGTEDQEEVFIMTTVDLEDPDTVLKPVLDRLVSLQLDEGVPIYVVPVHTPERIAETRQLLAGLPQRSR